MMLENFITMIVPRIFLGILILGALISIGKAAFSGSISYGYKYYKPEQICKRKENPVGYWMGIVLYSCAIIGIGFLMIGI